MYICVLDTEGKVRVHRNGPATPEHFLTTIAAYREDIVVAVECIFTCAQEGVPFVLGHALYMKAIHGGKAKNDKIDAHKLAVLLHGGMLPMAYVGQARPRARQAQGPHHPGRSTIFPAPRAPKSCGLPLPRAGS